MSTADKKQVQKIRTLTHKRNRLVRHVKVNTADRTAFQALAKLGVAVNIPDKRNHMQGKEFKQSVKRVIVAPNTNRLKVPLLLLSQANHAKSTENFIDGHHLVRHSRIKQIQHHW